MNLADQIKLDKALETYGVDLDVGQFAKLAKGSYSYSKQLINTVIAETDAMQEGVESDLLTKHYDKQP